MNAHLVLDLQLYALRREQGRLAEVVEVVERAVDEYPGYPVWRYVLIDVLAELGRTADARAVLARAGAEDYEVYLDMQWLFSMSLLADVCRSLDDADTADGRVRAPAAVRTPQRRAPARALLRLRLARAR